MKNALALLTLLAGSALVAQPTNTTASRIRFGASLPSTCNPAIGEVFFINAGGSLGPYYCSAPNTWSAITGSSVGAAFSILTGGTNTTAAMVCGTGCSLITSGSGEISANTINGGGIAGTLNNLVKFGAGNTLTDSTVTYGTGANQLLQLNGSGQIPAIGLVTPTITDFTNATHNHQNAAGGGTLAEAALVLTNITTNNATTSAHGFLPILPSTTTTFLNGNGAFTAPFALTTTGTSGAATFSAGTLNIPQYTGGANTALSNLASVSINTSLIPQTGVDLGAQATPFRNIFFYGAGTFSTTSMKITGTPTGTRVWTFQDTTDTIVGLATTDTLTNKTLTTPTIGSFVNATHTHANAAGGGQLNIPNASNATGTPSSSTFLRGDNTWAAAGGTGTVTVVGAGNLTSTDCVTGGGSQTIQTPSANCTVDSSGNLKAASIATGTSPPSITAGTGGGIGWGEGTAPSVCATSAVDCLYSDSTQHGLLLSVNNGSYLPIPQGPASTTSGNVALWNASNGGVLSDAGFLGSNVVRKDAANAFAAAGSINLSSSTVANGLRAPVVAGGTTSAAGAIIFDSTANNYHVYANGADAIVAPIASAPTTGHCPQFAVSSGNVLLVDSGSTNCGGGGSVNWNGIGNPAGNLSLTMAADTSLFTYNATTGSGVDLFKLVDTSSNTGTGNILRVSTAASSSAHPVEFDNNGNGVQMSTVGVLSKVGTGSVNADALNGTAFSGTSGHLVSFGVANIPADSGVVAANVVNASAPGAGVAHFPGSSQTATSSAVVSNDLNITTTTCTSQFVSAISAGAVGTCTSVPPAALGASTYDTQTDGATVTWNLASVLNAQGTLTFTVHSGSRTLNIQNPRIGGNYTLKLIQDGTGGEGLTLGTGCTWLVANGGMGAVTLTNAANALDVLLFQYDGTNCLTNLLPTLK